MGWHHPFPGKWDVSGQIIPDPERLSELESSWNIFSRYFSSLGVMWLRMSNSKIWVKMRISGNFCRPVRITGKEREGGWERWPRCEKNLSYLTFFSWEWRALKIFFPLQRKTHELQVLKHPKIPWRRQRLANSRELPWFGRRLRCWDFGKGDSCILHSGGKGFLVTNFSYLLWIWCLCPVVTQG